MSGEKRKSISYYDVKTNTVYPTQRIYNTYYAKLYKFYLAKVEDDDVEISYVWLKKNGEYEYWEDLDSEKFVYIKKEFK